MKGDLKKNVSHIIHKISPRPSFPKRGIFSFFPKRDISESMTRRNLVIRLQEY
jgi:hypothetical protein